MCTFNDLNIEYDKFSQRSTAKSFQKDCPCCFMRVSFLIFPSLSVLANDLLPVLCLVLYPHHNRQFSYARKGAWHIQPRTPPEEFSLRWELLHWACIYCFAAYVLSLETFLQLCASCNAFSFYLNTMFYLCSVTEWEKHQMWVVLCSALPSCLHKMPTSHCHRIAQLKLKALGSFTVGK